MYFQFMKKGPLTGPSAKRKYLYNYACLILLLFLLGSKKSMAAPVQDTLVPVSGLVTDEKGDPFPGVTVYVPALKTGTASDANGRYQVKVPAKGTLIFKAVGFGTQELPVNGRSKITVKMEAENANLNEVVVTGYTSKRLSQVSSSVAVVTGKQLNDVTSNNVASLLQGKVAGVVVQNASGNPSVAANVTIRGSSSITAGSGPLYVVDGIVGGTANPNDIASVTILKDAAAAGLYGARASNGVIIITTKSGQAGKTQISLNSSVGFNKMSMGNMKLMNSQQLYDYQKSYFAPADFARDRPASLLSQNTDWMDLAYHTGLTQNHLLSVSGGSEKTQFYVSGNYYKEEGIIRHTSNEVYNLRANITHRINEKLKLTTRINAASRNFENEASGNYGALVLSKINLPWDNPYNADGSIKMGTEEGWIGREHDNFLHGWQFNYDKGKQLTTAADVNLDYYITPNLTFSTYNRVSYSNLRSELYYDVRSKAGRGLGELYNNSGYESKLITSNRLSYQRTFGEHALSAIAVAEGEKNYVENNSLYGNKIPAGLHIMDAAANIQQSPFGPGSKSENRFTKGLVQVDYTYREKYNLIGAYINEASSRFGANHRSAGFYTLGASWILSSEPFMKDQRLIDQLKIRASYGITGNAEIGDYQSLGIYAYTSQYASNPGSVPSVLQNPDLTWEKSKTTNIGLDIDLLKRITLTVDVYDKTTSALLLDVPVPYTSGYDYITRNVGSVRNRGIEFNLNTRNINSAHFKWETSFNLSINRNKVLKLNNREDIAYSSLQWISEGRDLYSWHMRKWAGVDAKNGDPLWEVVSTDANGKQTISTTNSYDDATLQYAGTASPDFTGGINNRFSWKGFTLSAFFNFVSGNQVYEENTNDGSEPTSNSRVLPKNRTRWQKEGDIATDPKAVYGGNKNSDLESSRFLQDGSYLRLRNVTFSYDVPESFLRRIKVNNARVFISGDNLWTLTGFSGMDPEMGLRPYAQPVGESGNNFQQNSTKYPLSKKVLVGINVTF
ncbi:SusC/RagA family TonB-linked outer membrane protein [Chitinophaga sp. GbtcB8]|uniref:SusC/RagA family TonB-linked outer membrane protein n=1 Tax=Chitinophaga sp. GbtcB8 TaxID=2824753 RepID=UPI001C2F8ACC|nr:SusC/RagA family TonB-linked outer membrane protein [Chitinophaga sp. GbtcB8]